MSALDTESRAAPHMEHISTHIQQIHEAPACTQEQIRRSSRGSPTPLETSARSHTDLAIPGHTRCLERTIYPNHLAALARCAHLQKEGPTGPMQL